MKQLPEILPAPYSNKQEPSTEAKPADISAEHSDALSMWRSRLARFGDRPFLYYFDTPVTADTVEAESDALAAAFAARGLGRGDRVALYLRNVPQFVGLLTARSTTSVTAAGTTCPRRVEVLPDLPKTPTGKLLRRELRERTGDTR
jgi:acyl-CoA synthetase (AMP-forming)/AMP-acid ligase II